MNVRLNLLWLTLPNPQISRRMQVADRQGSASISSVLCGIEWVLQNKAAAVINLSLDGAATSADKVPCDGTDATSALHQAICGAINQGMLEVSGTTST